MDLKRKIEEWLMQKGFLEFATILFMTSFIISKCYLVEILALKMLWIIMKSSVFYRDDIDIERIREILTKKRKKKKWKMKNEKKKKKKKK